MTRNCNDVEAEVVRRWQASRPHDGEPSNWAELYAFFSGAGLTLLGTLILLMVVGIHP